MRSIRSVAATVALTVVLVTAGCAGTFDGATAPGTTTATPAETEDTGGRTIQVVAAGQVDAEPDQALVRVAVVETASNITTVRRRLAANVSQLRAALADRDIRDDRISTAFFDISRERRQPRPGEGAARTPYRGIHAFAITVDPNRTGEIIDAAIGNGASRIDDVRFVLSEPTRRALRNEVLSDALANARTQAETIAASMNLTVAGVRSVRTVDTGPGIAAAGEVTASAEGGAPTEIASGPVTVTTRVQVTYNATTAQ